MIGLSAYISLTANPLEETRLSSRVQRPPAMTDPRLATALAHPIRVHALSVLNTRTASISELAAEIERPINNVSYHVKVLVKLGCAELVDADPVQGGRVIESRYRARTLQYFDQEAWDQLDMKGKWGVVVPIMRLASKDISDSMAAGAFLDPDDNHISRTPMVVDEEGWEEVKAILADALGQLLEVPDRAAERVANKPDSGTIAIKVHMLQFRSPDRDKRT